MSARQTRGKTATNSATNASNTTSNGGNTTTKKTNSSSSSTAANQEKLFEDPYAIISDQPATLCTPEGKTHSTHLSFPL